jgi:predicted PurR-regulated permease PerM
MSAGEIAGLIAAVAFVLLVGVLAVPLIKLGSVLDETRNLIKGVSDETVPLLNEVTTTVTTTNAQLVRVDAITSNMQAVSTNVSALSGLFAATLGGPMVKAAAFTYGVRRALSDRSRGQVERRVRAEIKAERAAARAGRRRRGRAAS